MGCQLFLGNAWSELVGRFPGLKQVMCGMSLAEHGFVSPLSSLFHWSKANRKNKKNVSSSKAASPLVTRNICRNSKATSYHHNVHFEALLNPFGYNCKRLQTDCCVARMPLLASRLDFHVRVFPLPNLTPPSPQNRDA